jgi:hypothetical protein
MRRVRRHCHGGESGQRSQTDPNALHALSIAAAIAGGAMARRRWHRLSRCSPRRYRI